MLEKPPLPDQQILDCLRAAYGLSIAQLTFLPLGADANTAVYRASAVEGAAYFVKLRRGSFDEITVRLPHYLHSQGLQTVMAPLESTTHELSVPLDEYRLILYPYITGQDGYTQTASPRQWIEFGAALKAIHSLQLPPDLRRALPCDTFSPTAREQVRQFQARVEQQDFAEPVAARLAAFMRQHHQEITRVVDAAEKLALGLQERPLEPVVCHADIHPGNLHLAPDGALYLVDWDNPILAPRERDLAMIGGCSAWSDPQAQALFYQGYAQANPEPLALAYYRLERIVQDFAAFCAQLLLSSEGSDDRPQSYNYFTSNFLPGHEIDLAFQALPGGLIPGSAAETL